MDPIVQSLEARHNQQLRQGLMEAEQQRPSQGIEGRMTTQYERDAELEDDGVKSNSEENRLVEILGEIAKLESSRVVAQANIDELEKKISELRNKSTDLKEELQALVEVRSRWVSDLVTEYPWFRVYPKDSGDDVK